MRPRSCSRGRDPRECKRAKPRTSVDRSLILNECRENYRRAEDYGADLPSLGNRWGVFKQEMSARIRNFGSLEEAIEFGQLRCNFDHRGKVGPTDIPEIQMARRLLAYEYPIHAGLIDTFSDTSASAPGTYLTLPVAGGRSVLASRILYFHAFYILTVLSQIENVRSICEIGGGYGNPAWLWMNCPAGPIHTYCIVDLPESLFFAEAFLRSALPDVRVEYAHGEGPLEGEPAERTVRLVPVQHHARTGAMRFDVVVNTGSLAEMPDAWVAFWSDWLDRQNARHFYSHNYFGNPVNKLFEGRATFAPRVPNGWEATYIRAMHPLMLLQSRERRAAEIIFTKTAEPADRCALGAFLRGMDGLKLSLESYIALSYRARQRNRRNLPDAVTFIRKVLRDFGYAPVELLSLASGMIADDEFKDLEVAERDYVLNLHAELRQKFESAYPRGTLAT